MPFSERTRECNDDVSALQRLSGNTTLPLGGRACCAMCRQSKTPLAALREGIALLDDEVTEPLADGQREVVHILRHNAHRLQGRIEDLLDFNAAVFDARRLQRSTIALQALLAQVADGQRLQAKSRDVDIALTSDAATIDFDAAKLSVAIGNLLANAISFSASGGVVTPRAAARPDTSISTASIPARASPKTTFRAFSTPSRRGVARERHPVRAAASACPLSASMFRPMVAGVPLLSGEGGAHFRIELPVST